MPAQKKGAALAGATPGTTALLGGNAKSVSTPHKLDQVASAASERWIDQLIAETRPRLATPGWTRLVAADRADTALGAALCRAVAERGRR